MPDEPVVVVYDATESISGGLKTLADLRAWIEYAVNAIIFVDEDTGDLIIHMTGRAT